MNPPKFKHDQTVYTCWNDVSPSYREMVIESIEFTNKGEWLYKGVTPNTNFRQDRQFYESELSDHVPTLEDRVKSQIHIQVKDKPNKYWETVVLEYDVFEWLVIKAGYWRDEYKIKMDTEN